MPRFGVRLARGVALSLPAIMMHVYPGPHAMHVIGIAPREGINGGAVLGPRPQTGCRPGSRCALVTRGPCGRMTRLLRTIARAARKAHAGLRFQAAKNQRKRASSQGG